VEPLERLADWVRPDEMHQTFNFAYLETPWHARTLRDVIQRSIDAFSAVGAPSTWVLSNHDVVRHSTRLSLTVANPQGQGLGPRSPGLPDTAAGLARARAATALMLALPGSAYLFQGEELGLPEALDLPDEARQDPTWFRTNGARYGRDGCRVPIPWEASAPSFGFSSSGLSWLPQPATWSAHARDAQDQDPGSTLSLYRQAIAVRKDRRLAEGAIAWINGLPEDVIAFRNQGVTVLANLGSTELALPAGQVLLSSGPTRGALAPDTTVWLQE
jgi:alpha-glucosidase